MSHRQRTPQTYRDRERRGDVASRFAVFLAGMNGYDALVLPKRQCPDRYPRLRFAFTDNGDIVIGRRMVQTKWVNIPWTDSRDFPYDMMIVDEWHKLNRSITQNASAYWIFNRSLTAVCVFRMTLCRHVVCRTMYNKDVDQQRSIKYAMAPLNLLQWNAIPDATRQSAIDWGVIPDNYIDTSVGKQSM